MTRLDVDQAASLQSRGSSSFTQGAQAARSKAVSCGSARLRPAQYTHPVQVEQGDIDFMGHVNNAIYLTWVQEAVIAHWKLIAGPEAVSAHVWVALKHEITYRKPAFLGDDIVAAVTLEQVRRESAFYETTIRRGEEVLARVKSRWCCLDALTLRPTRIADDVVRKFLPNVFDQKDQESDPRLTVRHPDNAVTDPARSA